MFLLIGFVHPVLVQFVEDELKRRNYMRVYIYKVIRSEDPENRTFVPKEPEIKTNKEFIEENGFYES